ncbi:MAG: hypothetical protein Q7S46_01230, partial [Gallionella sp.]|nr:hypothetical protein [Gallionella sp.]
TFFIGVFTIFISSLLIYRDISQGDFFPVDNKIGGSSAPVTAELIGEVVSDFKTKSDKFNQLISNRSISVDPSR